MDVDIFADANNEYLILPNAKKEAGGPDVFAHMPSTMNPPESLAIAKEAATTIDLSELPLHSHRGGGFRQDELLASVTAAQAKALGCGLCNRVVREAIRMDNAAGLMPSCDHVFCASCLGQGLFIGGSSEGFSCPACRRWVRTVHADPFLDSLVLTLLTPAVRARMVAPGPRAHKHYSLQFKQGTIEAWDSQGWSAVHKLHPHLPWRLQTIGEGTLPCS